MSPPEVWGPAVWTLFHTLAEKVNEQAYPFVKVQLFAQIKRICGFLPCPECSTDATNFLAKININDLKTNVHFKNLFYLFHNYVNAKKRKPLFNYSSLASYNNYGIIPVINNFISKYNTKGNMKLLAESFQRKLVVGEFSSWFKKTILAFTPPPNIPSPISEIVVDESISVSVTEEETIVTTENTALITEETPATEEVAVIEETVTTEETVATEEVGISSEEVVATEEVGISSEEVVATEETVATEEFGISSEEVVTEEVVVQPKSKKGRKSKK